MTPTYWFLLVLASAALLGGGFCAGWAACYQARDLDVLAAEREGRARGMAQGVAQGQLEGYNGGFTAGWRAAHRLALTELGAYPTSRGGKRIVKALAASVKPEPPRIEWSWVSGVEGETKHINVTLQSEDAPAVAPSTPGGAP